jgi:protein-L-isoaspartate(D-aspartate) O-methyltransferase
MSFYAQPGDFAALRQQMVESQIVGRGIGDLRVVDAMRRVPRHEFTVEHYRDQAYEDHPLPIGEGQTISQPYIVAIMLEVLALKQDDRVLEVGTGSGYVTALLSELTAQVFSIERHGVLAAEARRVLARLGYTNAVVVTGDGTQGLSTHAPYDAIIVSAATPEVPPALLPQLREGGRMIVPVGPVDSQQLQLIRLQNGSPQTEIREACRFVPLIPGPEGSGD